MKIIDEKQVASIQRGLGIVQAAANLTTDKTLRSLLTDALVLIDSAMAEEEKE